jgi:hypothetical protein
VEDDDGEDDDDDEDEDEDEDEDLSRTVVPREKMSFWRFNCDESLLMKMCPFKEDSSSIFSS